MTKTRHTSRNSDIKMIRHLFEESMYHEKDFNRKGKGKGKKFRRPFHFSKGSGRDEKKKAEMKDVL